MNSSSSTFPLYDDKETFSPVRPLGPTTGKVKSGAGGPAGCELVGDWVGLGEVGLGVGVTAVVGVTPVIGLGVGVSREYEGVGVIVAPRWVVFFTSEYKSSLSRYDAQTATTQAAPPTRNILRLGLDKIHQDDFVFES